MLHLPPKTPGGKNGGFQHIRTICVKMGIFSEKTMLNILKPPPLQVFHLSTLAGGSAPKLFAWSCELSTKNHAASKAANGGRTRSCKFMGCAYISWHVQQPCRCRKKRDWKSEETNKNTSIPSKTKTSLELSSMWVTHFLSSISVPIIVFHPVDVLIGTTDVSKHIQK